MKKQIRFQVRVQEPLLDDFDKIVGQGNRSKKIVELMAQFVTKFNKKSDKQL